MAESNADKSAKPDKSARPASSPSVSAPEEMVKDLDVKVSEEQQGKVTGGWIKASFD